jgi:hypothetical protein
MKVAKKLNFELMFAKKIKRLIVEKKILISFVSVV